MTATLEQLGITAEKIAGYDQRIPRYTSYPTAPFWSNGFGPTDWVDHLQAHPGTGRPLALYIHIPFCEKHCLFCACNTIITPKREVAEDYLDWLEREIALTTQAQPATGNVVQLHFGGGTPNYLDNEQMARVVNGLRESFPFEPDAELSIEVDPRVASVEDIEAFREIGFGRVSFGTQDFHEETQYAIGRGQTKAVTFANVETARRVGFSSVNIDLIYGLPRQTKESWQETLDAVVELQPDRIALYNFAFLPSKLAHQRALSQELLPDPALKLQFFIEAHDRLTREGYVFIGMDHYARADDTLARALEAGTLRRNFMGYNTLRGVDMLAFGTSAIADYQGVYTQNTKKLSVYKRMIAEGVLPIERGLVMSEDDSLRRFVIEEIMCNGVLKLDDQQPWPEARLRAVVDAECDRLAPLADDGLIEMGDNSIRVTTKGRIFLRNIAVLFDAYMHQKTEKPLFSRSV